MKAYKRRWFYKDGTAYEDYTIIFDDSFYVVAINDNTQKFCFGQKEDFGTLYGFPVEWSGLTAQEVKEVINDLIHLASNRVDEYKECMNGSMEEDRAGWQAMLVHAEKGLYRWEAMLKSLLNWK